MEFEIQALFDPVERYVGPLIDSNTMSSLSKQENKVLALQNINRLNIRLGKMARSAKDESGNLRILQTYVNNLTVAIKYDNVPLIKSSLTSTRSIIKEIEKIR